MTHPTKNNLPNWKPCLLAMGLILTWVGYWYWGTLEAMAEIWWRSETYAHGLVVPPISLWLIWRERHRLASCLPQPTYWFVLPIGSLVFLWLLGELTAVNALTQFSVIGIITLSVMSLLGLPISKTLAFPLLFLFFSVPVGDFLLPLLVEKTADFTVLALRLTGIPVFREGQNFVIPSGQWSVVEACSGIRYLIASLTVGTLYAYLTYSSLKRRLIFVLVAILVPIVANWVRAYLIVLLGHFSGNKLAAGADHLIYGWVFFGIVIAIMFAIGMRWAEPVDTEPKSESISSNYNNWPANPWVISLLIAVVIAAGPLYNICIQQSNSAAIIKLSPVPPSGSWREVAPPIDWKPLYSNPSDVLNTAYGVEDTWVGLYIAYYQSQNFERKLVTSTNVLVSSKDPKWQIVSDASARASLGNTEFGIREAELFDKLSSSDNRYIIWQWYWIDGHLTSSDIEAKLLTAWAMLTGHGDDSAVVIIYAPQESASKLSSFAREQGEAILTNLAEARQK